MAAASVKLDKPSSREETRHGKRESHNNCGQMITEMASRIFKTFTENRYMMIKNRGPTRHQTRPNNQTHDHHEEQAVLCHGSACTWKPSSGGTADAKNKDKQGGNGTKKEQSPTNKKKGKNDDNSSDSSDNES